MSASLTRAESVLRGRRPYRAGDHRGLLTIEVAKLMGFAAIPLGGAVAFVGDAGPRAELWRRSAALTSSR